MGDWSFGEEEHGEVLRLKALEACQGSSMTFLREGRKCRALKNKKLKKKKRLGGKQGCRKPIRTQGKKRLGKIPKSRKGGFKFSGNLTEFFFMPSAIFPFMGSIGMTREWQRFSSR